MTHNENIQDKKGVRLVQNVHDAQLPIPAQEYRFVHL